MFSQVYFQLVDFLLLSTFISCSANKQRCLSKGFLPYFITVILALLFLPLIGCAFFPDFSKSYHKQIVLLFLFSKAIIYIFHCLTLLAEIHPASLSSCEDVGIFFLLLTLNGRLLMLHCYVWCPLYNFFLIFPIRMRFLSSLSVLKSVITNQYCLLSNGFLTNPYIYLTFPFVLLIQGIILILKSVSNSIFNIT